MAAPVGLVRFTPFSVSLNLLSLYILNEPSVEVPVSMYSIFLTEEFMVTCAPFRVTVTPSAGLVTVAVLPAY